ncbi:MAG: hypothetical protein AB8B85_16270 [Paracoccaceae bacterium]
MWRSLSLLAPAIIPSWRFFQSIEPSPRIEIAVRPDANGVVFWQQFRPRPARLSAFKILGRLVWNPWWNECLYLTSLAERLILDDRDHAQNEIIERIKADMPGHSTATPRFRIVVVRREDDGLVTEVVWTSPQPP